jgi:hypothetical protein
MEGLSYLRASEGWRPADWRWRLAVYLFEHPRDRWRKYADDGVKQALAFERAYRRCQNDQARERLAKRQTDCPRRQFRRPPDDDCGKGHALLGRLSGRHGGRRGRTNEGPLSLPPGCGRRPFAEQCGLRLEAQAVRRSAGQGGARDDQGNSLPGILEAASSNLRSRLPLQAPSRPRQPARQAGLCPSLLQGSG